MCILAADTHCHHHCYIHNIHLDYTIQTSIALDGKTATKPFDTSLLSLPCTSFSSLTYQVWHLPGWSRLL
jgi:hypothetical protein